MPNRIPTHAELMAPRREREYNRARRGDQAFYKSARWLKLRAAKLIADPICERCKRAVATEVNHKEDRATRPDLELDPNNLESCCKPCHSSHTAKTRAARPTGEMKIRRLGD